MRSTIPEYVDPRPWLERARGANDGAVRSAILAESPDPADLAVLLSPAAAPHLEAMAARARALTERHFGRTVSLYVPLYLSNHCSSGCAYCGFASDRPVPRRRLTPPETERELRQLKNMGFDEVLLLTGERTPEVGFFFLRDAVVMAARHFHNVTIEAFPMTTDEYGEIAQAGCTGITLYQETYDPGPYRRLHRWGHKRDYAARLGAPARALDAGLRTAGIGVLLGLADPLADAISLFLHARHLRGRFWRSGISISFPRVCRQTGDFTPPHPVDEKFLARMIFAFRICLPDVPLVLSTRENPRFRNGMAGIGISKMSVASRTTVGGYSGKPGSRLGQFDVNDNRDVKTFCRMLRRKKLEPVFKNWDSVYR